MKTAKVLLRFKKLTDADLPVQANTILNAMTGNAHFPGTQPSLAALGETIKNFDDALVASQTRHKVSVAVKKNMRRELEKVLTALATEVNYIAKGDRLMLISSGFDVNAEFSSPKPLDEPKNFTVQPAKSGGEVWVSVDRVPRGKTYIYFYATTPVLNDAWQHVIGGGPNHVITGLDPVKQYSFRIGIAGARGQSVYTGIITRMV